MTFYLIKIVPFVILGVILCGSAKGDNSDSIFCGEFEIEKEWANQISLLSKNLPSLYSLDMQRALGEDPCRMTQEVAHRGDISYAPQNTYPAIASAVKKKAKFIEIDVYLT